MEHMEFYLVLTVIIYRKVNLFFKNFNSSTTAHNKRQRQYILANAIYSSVN